MAEDASQELSASVEAVSGNAVGEDTEQTVSASSGHVTFDQALADLFDNSMTITDSQIFQVANAMQNDFSKVEESSLIEKDKIKGLIKSFEAAKTEYFLGTGKCSFDAEVQKEWDRENQFLRFGFSHGETITKLLPRVRTDKVTVSGNTAAVDLYEWMTIGYQDQGSTAENASGTGYQYTLNLTKQDAGWKIVSVSGTEQNYSNLEAEGVKISDSGISVEAEDKNSRSVQNDAADAGGSAPALVGASYPESDKISWNYSINKAVAYANEYALDKNEDYSWWGDRGGDCANFVSQCLYAGGFPLTKKWHKDTSAWIGQNELRNYLTTIKAGKLIEDPKDSDIAVGNPIWYNWDGEGKRTNHVTICVGTNEDGVPIIDSHTTARYHYKWNYGYDDTTFITMQLKQSSGTNVYRLYNPNSGEHFYTSGLAEKKYLVKIGWQDEGIGWKSTSKNAGVPIYRLYNPNAGDHHYTVSAGERDALIKVGWNYEGVLAYTLKSSDSPLYRLYNPNAKKAGAHHYTTNKGEVDYLKKIGWRYEGICWYSL